MSPTLHAAARDRLTVALADALRAVEVRNNKFVAIRSLANLEALDAILPGPQSEMRRALIEQIGESPLSDFIADQLHSELITRQYDDKAPRRLLSDLDGFTDVNSSAADLLNRFETLPWRYTLLVRVPHEAAELLAGALPALPWNLSPGIDIIRVAEDSEYHTADLPEFRSAILDAPSGVSAGTVYVRYEAVGYIGRFLTTTPLRELQFTLRAIYGSLLAFRIVRTGASSSFVPRKMHTLVYRQTKDGYKFEEPQQLDQRLGEALWHIGSGRPFTNLEEPTRSAFAREELRAVRAAFNDKDGSERVRRAAQWLFDSYASDDNLLAFVQATVVLEILFGDKAVSDVIGLGELIANRCAYLIGKSRKQREEVIADFRRIYATRSKIVHTGKNALSKSEEEDLFTLRWMGARSIQEESRLALADSRREGGT